MGWRLGPCDSRRIGAPAADVGGAGGCAAPGDLAPLPLPRWSAWWSASCDVHEFGQSGSGHAHPLAEWAPSCR